MTPQEEAAISFVELQEEMEWRRCAPQTDDPGRLLDGFLYFCENYWFIKHPSQGRIKFDLFEAQIETVDLWLNERYSIVLKARQIGFSTLVAAFCFWLTFFYPDRTVIMLSRTEREAIKLLQKTKYGMRFLPEWMKNRGPAVNVTQTKIEFTNESYLESLPSASDPARGESVYLVVVDEIAFLPNSEEAWASIEPVADVGGRVIMLSTANGEGNLFHKLWQGAENGTNRFKHLFHPWSAAGRTQEWYETKVRDLPEWQLAQEYPSNPEEAFLKSGRPIFSAEMLHLLPVCGPISEGFLQKATRGHVYAEQSGGPLRVWEMPEKQVRYCIGADPAQGLEHGDFSVAHVIRVDTGEVVAVWHGHVEPDLFGSDVLAPLGRLYNGALIGVESNNHGLTTLKALQQVKYFPIYQQRTLQWRNPSKTEALGWRTTQVTKPVAVDELNKALREGSVILYDEYTVAELRTFVREPNGKMKGSPFDDRVMSLTIANQMIRHVHSAQYAVQTEPPPGTIGHFINSMIGKPGARKSTRSEPETIGKHYIRAS